MKNIKKKGKTWSGISPCEVSICLYVLCVLMGSYTVSNRDSWWSTESAGGLIKHPTHETIHLCHSLTSCINTHTGPYSDAPYRLWSPELNTCSRYTFKERKHCADLPVVPRAKLCRQIHRRWPTRWVGRGAQQVSPEDMLKVQHNDQTLLQVQPYGSLLQEPHVCACSEPINTGPRKTQKCP